MNKGPWPSRARLRSTEEGDSGADYVLSSPIPGVEESPGVPAKSIRSILGIIASRAVPLLAKMDRSGILKASRDVADPTAIEASEKGATGGVAAQDDFAGHLSDLLDAHDASSISYAGSAGLQSVDVEAALDELDSEKAPNAHRHDNATTTADGYQSKEDKAKLDGIAEGGGTPDATVSVKGKARASVAPGVASDPVFVGDNDPRVLERDGRCVLTRTTAQVVSQAIWTPVQWDAETEDPRNWHNGSTAALSTRVAPDGEGVYLVTVYTIWGANVSGARGARITHNGATVLAQDGTNSTNGAFSEGPQTTSVEKRLLAGEYFTVEVFQNRGGDLALSAASRVTVTRVRR